MFRPIYLAVVLAGASGSALAQSDLMTIYQEALLNSADLAAAEADALARQEILPQAKAQLLPNIGLGAGVARERVDVEGAGSDSYSTHYYQASLRSEEHTSELQSRPHLVCRLLLEKKKTK